MTDPVEFLNPTPEAPDPARREQLLRLTARRIRPRPRRWPALLALGIGLAVGWFAKPPTERVERVEVPVEVRVGVPVRVEVPVSEPKLVAVAVPEPPTPERLELDAELSDDRAEVARLYRAAGDAFLARTDFGESARCYRLALRSAPPLDRRVTGDDSWLLAQMKVSLTREVQ